MALNHERIAVCSMKAEIREQSIALFNLSWEHVSWVTRFFHHYAQCPQMTMKMPGVLILGSGQIW